LVERTTVTLMVQVAGGGVYFRPFWAKPRATPEMAKKPARTSNKNLRIEETAMGESINDLRGCHI
jgi:hypothetical protein